MMLPPARTVVLPVLVMATSACGVTVVLTREPMLEPSLLDGTGSPVLELAEAVLVKEPLAGALTVTVKLVVAPLARPAMEGQFTVLPLKSPPPEALTNVTFKGRLSLTTTLLAVDGPRFVTVIV